MRSDKAGDSQHAWLCVSAVLFPESAVCEPFVVRIVLHWEGRVEGVDGVDLEDVGQQVEVLVVDVAGGRLAVAVLLAERIAFVLARFKAGREYPC